MIFVLALYFTPAFSSSKGAADGSVYDCPWFFSALYPESAVLDVLKAGSSGPPAQSSVSAVGRLLLDIAAYQEPPSYIAFEHPFSDRLKRVLDEVFVFVHSIGWFSSTSTALLRHKQPKLLQFFGADELQRSNQQTILEQDEDEEGRDDDDKKHKSSKEAMEESSLDSATLQARAVFRRCVLAGVMDVRAGGRAGV